jgi:spore coat protein U-like protein
MNRNRLLIVAALFAMAALVPAGAHAQATANLAVTASVSANCTISTTAVAFGAYDPIFANDTAARDAAGNVRIACTKGATPTIGLGLGSNASGSVRRMLGAAGEYLTYELYQPVGSGYVTVWGTTGANLFPAGLSTSRAPRDFAVNGRILGGQDVATGSYVDSVVATVNF